MKRRFLTALLGLGLAACHTPAPQPAPAPAPLPPRATPPVTVPAPAPAVVAPAPTPPAEPAPPPPAPLPASLSPLQVEKTFSLHRRYFAKAYGERLHAHPGLAGTVFVDFTINADGTTQGVRRVESSTRDATFDAAIVSVVAAMNFPPAQGATPVSRYPVSFTAPPKGQNGRKGKK